jgi:hypothetical protein
VVHGLNVAAAIVEAVEKQSDLSEIDAAKKKDAAAARAAGAR